jgi:hypothetical protein
VLPPEPYPPLTDQTPTSWPYLRDAVRAGCRDGVHFERARGAWPA